MTGYIINYFQAEELKELIPTPEEHKPEAAHLGAWQLRVLLVGNSSHR